MRGEVAQGDRFLFGAVGALAALLLECFCWGFTVDDAWIVSRVAAHGAEAGTFAFNRGQTPTDAVTPLGWAHLLGWLGRWLGLATKSEFWSLARYLGVTAHVSAFALVGYFGAARRDLTGLLSLFLLVLLCVPAGIWAGAGLTTPVVGLILLLGAVLLEKGSQILGCLCLGAAAAWRPELVPTVCAICLLQVAQRRWPVRLKNVLLVAAPSLLVMLVRALQFDSVFPLSSIAKQADWSSGVRYALMTSIWSGVPWLLLLGLLGRPRRWWVVAWSVHLLALVFAGGDWMPGLRLSAPLLPWVAWRSVRLLQPSRRIAWLLLVAIFPLRLLWAQGDDLRRVSERRWALVESARGVLDGYSTIATVDIGWVGMATDAKIVDLAGVTEPRIAQLPGGHTSKAIFPGMFSGRDVDAWIVRAAVPERLHDRDIMAIEPLYWVDARLLQRFADLNMSAEHYWDLQGAPGGYVLFVSRR